MVNYLKKLIAIVLLAFATVLVCNVNVFAQETGAGAVGAHFTGGFGNDYMNYGIGGKLQLNVLYPLRFEGSFTAFLKNKDISMVGGDLNVHWLVFLSDRLFFYPLAGLGYYQTTLHKPEVEYGGMIADGSGKLSMSKPCVNAGAGFDIYLTDVIILNLEAKYKYLKLINDGSRINVSLGLAYLF